MSISNRKVLSILRRRVGTLKREETELKEKGNLRSESSRRLNRRSRESWKFGRGKESRRGRSRGRRKREKRKIESLKKIRRERSRRERRLIETDREEMKKISEKKSRFKRLKTESERRKRPDETENMNSSNRSSKRKLSTHMISRRKWRRRRKS